MTDLHARPVARLAPRGNVGAHRPKRPASTFAVLGQFAPEGHRGQ
jgi:hypothetical protein